MSDKQQILFIWKVPEYLKKYFTEVLDDSKFDLIFEDSEDPTSFEPFAEQANIIVGWRPTEKLLEHANNCKLFINPGTGVQHLMTKEKPIFQKKGIKVLNNKSHAIFVAEHLFAMLLASCQALIPHHNWTVEGKWRTGDEAVKSIPISKRKIGLLGYGAINKHVHRFLSPMVERVSICRRHANKDEKYKYPTAQNTFEFSHFDNFLDNIDTLLVSVPLTPETDALIGSNELKKLGEIGMVFNVGRGPIIQEEALFNWLKENPNSRAGIDVWYEYKPEAIDGKKWPYTQPFHELKNIILSPHRGGSPLDDLQRWDEVIQNINAFARNESIINEVDFTKGY